jgi:hypothetical protein
LLGLLVVLVPFFPSSLPFRLPLLPCACLPWVLQEVLVEAPLLLLPLLLPLVVSKE